MWWHLGESAPGVGFTLADAVIFAQQHDQEEHGVI